MDLSSFYTSAHIILRYSAAAVAEDEADKLFLIEHHSNRYKFVNLDSDFVRNQGANRIFVGYDNFAFNSHNPCPLGNIIKFCTLLESYLSADPLNHVVLNGGAGEVGLNRSVFMLVCYFLFVGTYPNADVSVTSTIALLPIDQQSIVFLTPSQTRYIKYYERLLRSNGSKVFSYQLDQVSLLTVPLFASSIVVNGCSPNVIVTVHEEHSDPKKATSFTPKVVFKQLQANNRPYLYDAARHEHIDIPLAKSGVEFRGDVNISVYHSNDVKMFSIWLHTAFIDQPVLRFEKDQIDMASADLANRVFDQDFKVDILLHRIENTVLKQLSDQAEYTFIDHISLEPNNNA
jgi:hypothetical protein